MSDNNIGYRGILLGGKLLWNIVTGYYGQRAFVSLLELCSGQKELLFLCIFLSILHNTSHSITIIFYCFC